MIKTLYFIFYMSIHSYVVAQSFPHPSNDPNWYLIFNDDFNSNTLDLNKWSPENGTWTYFGINSWSDDANHIKIIEGELVLTATYETTPHFGYNYVGGYVISKAVYKANDFFEVSCKLESKPGGFPAAWLFSGAGSCKTNNYREIDIMEHFGDWPNSVQTGIHFCDGTSRDKITQWTTDFNVSNAQHHTYSGYWGKKKIEFYINHIKHYEVPNDWKVKGSAQFRLNQAVRNFEDKPPSRENFPISLYVDWVNIYRLRCDANTTVTEIPNFSTFNYAVKKWITLSNLTSVPIYSKISLRAEEYIELKDGFEVPEKTIFCLDINQCK